MNARKIGSLRPPTEDQVAKGYNAVDYWDRKTPGFGIRVSLGGTRTWLLRYTQAGRTKKITLGTYPRVGLADARKKAKQARHIVGLGTDLAGARREEKLAPTVADLAAHYIKDHVSRLRSAHEVERIINKEILPAWKDLKVKDLTRADVRDLLRPVAERAPVMANRVLAAVTGLLNFGIRHDVPKSRQPYLEANPAVLLEKPGGREEARDRALDPDEIKLLWAALSETSAQDKEGKSLPRLNTTLNDALKLLLLTAQRSKEVGLMKWSDLDLDGGWWTIPASDTKNAQAHRVPLCKTAVEILTARKADDWVDEMFVFSLSPGTNIRWRLRKASSALSRGLPFAFHVHDLRRTVATRLAEAKVSRTDLAYLLNHVDRGARATKVYDRYAYDAEKRTAINTWEQRLLSILAGRDSKVLAFSR